MTKKDIYKEFGIEYKAGKIFCEPLNTWVNLPMPIGTNSKVGNAATFSLYHGNEKRDISEFGNKTKAVLDSANMTCIKGTCACHCDGCYCDSGFYNFDSTKASAIQRTVIAYIALNWLEQAIKAEIKAEKIEQIRIHAQGDFFSKEYAEMWKRIAAMFPAVTFWTYTKVTFALDVLSGIDNLKIVPSVTPIGFNFGTCGELLEMHRALAEMGYKVHICACGTPYEKHCADCKTGCKAVGTECDFVLFIKHSTRDYKAGEKDVEEYNAICEIIRKQNN